MVRSLSLPVVPDVEKGKFDKEDSLECIIR